jgi:hypothetical protein
MVKLLKGRRQGPGARLNSAWLPSPTISRTVTSSAMRTMRTGAATGMAGSARTVSGSSSSRTAGEVESGEGALVRSDAHTDVISLHSGRKRTDR